MHGEYAPEVKYDELAFYVKSLIGIAICDMIYCRVLQTGGRDPLVGRKVVQWGSRDFKF